MELRAFESIDEELLAQIGRLRIEAWQTEIARAAETPVWIDRFDRTARHWIAFHEGRPVAAARLTVHPALAEVPDAESYAGVLSPSLPGPIASLNRLVVHPSARRAGLGGQLDRARLDAAEQLGCRAAILSTASGPSRVRHMERLGFVFAGFGPRFAQPPLCHLPPPAVLLCSLPRISQPSATASSTPLLAA